MNFNNINYIDFLKSTDFNSNSADESSAKKQRKEALPDPLFLSKKPLIPPVKMITREEVEKALDFKLNLEKHIDIKTLTMVIGDAFIKSSSLEGGTTRDAYKYLINFISLLPEEIIKRLTELNEFYNYESKISMKNKSIQLESISEWLADKVKNSNRCTFIGGYSGSTQGSSGHAVIFEVFCEGEFGTIRIFQQGDGIEYHSKQDLNYVRRHGAYYEKSQIPREILTNSVLYVAILGPKMFRRPYLKNWKGSIIYDFIAGVLPGVEVAADTYIKQMSGGLCYYKCYLSLFKTYMDEKSYNRFILCLKVSTFMAFKEDIKFKENHFEQAGYRFLAELAEKMQRSLKDHRQLKTIPDDSLNTIDDYLKYCIDWCQAHANHPIYSLPSRIEFKHLTVPTKELIEAIDQNNNSVHNLNLSDGCGVEFPQELIFEQPRSPDEICSHFERIISYLITTKEKTLYLNGLYTISLALSQFPSIKNLTNSFSTEWTREQLKHILGRIHSLMNKVMDLGLNVDLETKSEYELMFNTVSDWLYVVSAEAGAILFWVENKENCLRFDLGEKFPSVHEDYECPYVTTSNQFDECMPHAPGAIRKLLEDLLLINFESSNKTKGLFTKFKEPKKIEVHDNDLKLYEFLLKAASLDRMDVANLEKKWANGKYLMRLFEIKKNESELNAIANIVLIHIMLRTRSPINKLTLLDNELTFIGDDKGYYIKLEYEKDISNKPTLYNISPLNIAYNDATHPVIMGVCRNIDGFLTSFDWLQTIEEEPDILIDACPAIIKALTTHAVEENPQEKTGIYKLYASCGTTPLSMTLRSESGKMWVERLGEALLSAIEIQDEQFGSRSAAALLIAATVNLEIWRDQQQQNFCKKIEPIQFSKITSYDYSEIQLKSLWPVEALHFLSAPKLDPYLLITALCKITTQIGNCDLYEALHRRVFAETGASIKDFISPHLHAEHHSNYLPTPQNRQAWTCDFLGNFQAGDEYFEPATGLHLINGCGLVGLPPAAKTVIGYDIIQDLGLDKSFRIDPGARNRWLATDGSCRVNLNNVESYWEIRGDFLKKYITKQNKKFHSDDIDDMTYYIYSFFNFKNQMEAEKKMNILSEGEKWIRNDCEQILIISKTEHIFLWTNDTVYNSTTGLYLASRSQTKQVTTDQGKIELLDICDFIHQQLWANKEGVIQLLSIPKSGLHFKVIWSKDGQAKLFSNEHPGFEVVDKFSCVEGKGIPSIFLTNSNGKERLIIATPGTKRSQNIFNDDWVNTAPNEGELIVMERSGENSLKTNKELRSLFSGDINGLCFIVKGLLRIRNYDFAKKYVDLIVRTQIRTGINQHTSSIGAIKLEHPKSIVLKLRLYLHLGMWLEDLYQNYIQIYHLLPEGWLLSPEEERKLNILYADRIDNVIELNVNEGEGRQKRARFEEKQDDKTGELANHSRRLAKAVSINKSYSPITKWHKLTKQDEDKCESISIKNSVNNANPDTKFSLEHIFNLETLSLPHMIGLMSLCVNNNKTNLSWTLLEGLYLIMSRAGPSGTVNQTVCKSLIHKLRMKLTHNVNQEIILPSLPRHIADRFILEVNRDLNKDQGFAEFANQHFNFRVKLFNALKNEPQEAEKFFAQFQNKTFLNVPTVPYAAYNPRERKFQRHQLQRTHLGQRMYLTSEGIRTAINQRLKSNVKTMKDENSDPLQDYSQFTTQFLDCAKPFLEKYFEWRQTNDWTSDKAEIDEILNNLSHNNSLPIAKRKITELQHHLKKAVPRMELNLKDGLEVYKFEYDLEQFTSDALSKIEYYENKIIELLNPEDPKKLGEQLTEYHGFLWLSQLEEVPQSSKALELATYLKELSAQSIWFSTCTRAKKLLDQQKYAEMLQTFSNCFDCNGLKGVLPWKLAAFSWLHEISLRNDQADVLPQLIDKQDNCLLKLQTGFGKSQLLTPAAFHLFEMNLIINVVPAALLEEQVKQVRNISHAGGLRFAQFIYNNNFIADIPQPTGPFDRLCMVTSDHDLHKLIIRYYKALLQSIENEEDKSTNYQMVKKIEGDIKLLTEKSQGLFDEPQTLYDGTRETALGRKSVIGIPKDRGAVASVIFQILVQMKIFQAGSKEPILNFAKHRDQLANNLVEHPLFALVDQQEKEFVFNYLIRPANLKREEALKIESQRLLLGEERSRLVSIARAQLQLYLPFTLTERFKVSYGPKKGSLVARPYRAADTPANGNSTHAILETMINFTMQMHLIQGLTEIEVDSLIQALREEGPESAENILKRALIGTPFAKASFRELTILPKEQLTRIKHALQKSPLAAIEYVKLCVLPNLRYSTTKIRVTGASLSTLIPRAVAWSATPVNRFGYPLSLREGIIDLNVDLDTMYKLIDPTCTQLVPVNSFDPIDYAKNSDTYAAVDPQANLFQYNNLQVAKRILEGARSEIERVAYYDTNPSEENWKTIDRHGNILGLMSLRNMDRSVFYYIDQDRAEGTDVALPENSNVIIPLSAGITFSRLHQACGRARKWGKGQKITLLLDKSLWNTKPQELIKCSLENDGNGLQGLVITMHKDLMTEVCRARLHQRLFQTKSPEDLIALVSKTKKLIETEIDINDFYQIGLTPPPDDRTLIHDHYKELLDNYKEILLDEKDVQILSRLLEGCLSLIPSQSSSTVRWTQLSMTAEAEQEICVLQNHECENEGLLTGYDIEPEKVFESRNWQQEFLKNSDGTNNYSIGFPGKFKILGLGYALNLELFPPNLYISKSFLGKNWGDKIDESNQKMWKRLPQVQTILRVISNAGLLKFIIINNREAHQFAHYMRVIKDYKEKEEKWGFRATLLSITGATIMEAADAPFIKRSVEKATTLMLSILRGFNGTCPYEVDRDILIGWAKETKERQRTLHHYLIHRLEDKNMDHPDHPNRSPLVFALKQ